MGEVGEVGEGAGASSSAGFVAMCWICNEIYNMRKRKKMHIIYTDKHKFLFEHSFASAPSPPPLPKP